MRASLYCRISRDREGAGLGVQTQEQDCRALAEELGATVVAVHTDNDLSAYSGKPRPGYAALLAEIVNGQTDAVLAWHTDRLHRSPAELEDYITACETAGVRTITVKAGTVDLASPSGLVMARTLGAFARYEVDHARERMHRAKQRSADAGKWKGGRRPFGYEDDGVTIRQSEADLITQAADMILAGESVRAVARTWNATGSLTTTGKPWTDHAPRRILLRPRNAGLMEHRGQVVGDASWPAILEAEKWRAVVGILTDASRRTNGASLAGRWLGSGLFLCGVCGEPVNTDRRRDGGKTYRCRRVGEHVGRDLESVDAFVSGIIVERLRRDDVADLLRRDESSIDVKPLEARVVELDQRKKQLAGLFADGEIDAAQLSSGSKRLATQLEEVREQITAAYSASALAGVGDAPDPGQAWMDATLERKRLVLNALMSVTLLKSERGRPPGWSPGDSYFRPESVRIDWVEQ